MGGKSSKDSLSEEDLNLLVSSTNISAEEIQVTEKSKEDFLLQF